MRVLLARRFRGNRNAAQLLEEEGEDPQGEIGEEQEEVEETAIVDQLCQEESNLQNQSQTKPPKNHQKSQQPRDILLFTGKDNGKNRSSQKPLSPVSPQLQKPSPQRKRRLGKSGQEENDCKLRRRQTSISSSTKEEASFLDRKPRAREIGFAEKNKKSTAIFKSPQRTEVAATTGENTIPKEAASLSSSKAAALSTSSSRSNTSKENSHKMVSGGAGRNRQGREEEEHLLNWQYSINNRHSHHAVVQMRPADRDLGMAHDEPELMAQPTPETDFDGPLENDPASARGDVSSASPERQNNDSGNNARSSSSEIRIRDSGFVIGQREESPSLRPGASYERGRIAQLPRDASMPPGRRDMSRIAPAAESDRGTFSFHVSSRNGSNGSSNNNTKKASTTAEELRFRAVLKKERGLEIREQDGDGNCLFRAISLQVYGDPSMHGDVRKQCMDHMVSDWSIRVHLI